MGMEFDYWTSKAKEENPDYKDEAPEATVTVNEESPAVAVTVNEESPAVTSEVIEESPAVTSEVIEESPAVGPIVDVEPVVNGDASNMAFPISDSEVITDSSEIENTEEPIVEHNGHKGKRICKAVFLGVPFGIPVFVLMLACLSAVFSALCILFGALVMGSVLLAIGGIALILLGIAHVHLSLAPSFLLMGCGVLSTGLGLFLSWLTRLMFKYVLLGVLKWYLYPVKFVRIFFCERKSV